MKDLWEAQTEEKLDSGGFKKQVPQEVAEFFSEVEKSKWIRGGTKNDFEKIEKLILKWRDECIKESYYKKIPKKVKRKPNLNGIITSYRAENINITVDNDYYKKMFPNLSPYKLITEDEAEETAKALATRCIQIITLARSEELNNNKDGLAKIEYEILKGGGWLIGHNKKEVLVCFPYASETVMNKLRKMK